MRKAREVLRLHYEAQLGQREIARGLGLSQSTVHAYLERAKSAELQWPLPAGLSENGLRGLLYPKKPATTMPEPDWADVRQQLSQNKRLTLDMLWQDYKSHEPAGYCYSRYCVLYRRWLKQQDPVLRQQHNPGEKVWVDWAGDTVPVYKRLGEEDFRAQIFVAVLGASSYTYAEATRDQRLPNWLGAHTRAFAFFGGSPRLIVPDNLRAGVSKACRYDPDVNPLYQEWCAYHQVGVLPARPYKPRDKAKVESAVGVVERWILAALRHRRFHSLGELNESIATLLDRLNERPFRKQPGTRRSRFIELDQPALRPLPEQAFPWSGWGVARVNIDYHIVFEHNYYSTPYTLTGKQVDLRWTETTVEIFHNEQRVASHQRLRGHGLTATCEAHRPSSHRAHLEWPPSRLIEWAGKTGPQTAALFAAIMAEKPHPEMGYRGCLGILRLADKYSPQRVERASARAIAHQACRYRSVKNILERGLDREPLANVETPAAGAPAGHDNLRGPDYFSNEGEV
jgi:transposase